MFVQWRFFFKQKRAYDMRISDWSSDVCSSDLRRDDPSGRPHVIRGRAFDLPAGYHLFVGRDTLERGDFRSIMTRALAWAVLPALEIGSGSCRGRECQ